jgi:RNA polymerase sigma-70 factor (ECF subfamily)
MLGGGRRLPDPGPLPARHGAPVFAGKKAERRMDEVTPDSAETQDLLGQARRGDAAAFERLFARCRDDLRRMVDLRLEPRLRARVDPSDVVQEAQLEAFRRLADFLERQPMPFHLWLRKTAYERLLMLRRRHVAAARRSVAQEVELPDRSSQLLARRLLDTRATPAAQAERRELEERVSRALALLAEDDREILLLRNFEGLSYQEVGHLLDLVPATARKRHGRALLRLHKLLAEAATEGPAP